MKIASWNVNSLRVRLPHVLDWLDNEEPDVLGLQELKMTTDAVPADEIFQHGYHCEALGQKTYNGVAILSRTPAEDVTHGIPGFADEQARAISATTNGVRIVNLYVPNGQSVGSEKYAYKLEWLDALASWLISELDAHPDMVVMGDFNIAPDDRDVHDPESWHEKILCSSAERSKLQTLLDLGFEDSFRLFDQEPGTYSWWDYRAAAFRRNMGLRIDLLLVSPALASRCRTSAVDKAPRKLERPSDHAPAWLRLD